MSNTDSALSFSYQEGVDLPSNQERLWSFPAEARLGETLLVRFDVGNDWWIGRFSANSLGELTGVHRWPAEDIAAVFIRGAGYLVNVRNPEGWQSIDASFPVRNYYAVENKRVALLIGHVEMSSYSSTGRLWRSPRLALDDLSVLNVDGESIYCRGYLPDDDAYEFLVNLRTGEPLDPLVKEFGTRMTSPELKRAR